MIPGNEPFFLTIPVWSVRLIAFHESGLYNEIIERFVPPRIKCRVIEERPSNARVVQRLEMLFGVFILWIVGTVVASMAFVLENAVHKCELMRNSKSPVIRMSEWMQLIPGGIVKKSNSKLGVTFDLIHFWSSNFPFNLNLPLKNIK